MENPNPKRWDVISPDGFSIHREKTYASVEEATEAFHKWKQGYEHQGYYSTSRRDRIPLDELQEYCSIVEI